MWGQWQQVNHYEAKRILSLQIQYATLTLVPFPTALFHVGCCRTLPFHSYLQRAGYYFSKPLYIVKNEFQKNIYF